MRIRDRFAKASERKVEEISPDYEYKFIKRKLTETEPEAEKSEQKW